MSGRTIEDEKARGCWGYVLGDIDKFLEVLHQRQCPSLFLPQSNLTREDSHVESMAGRPRVARSALSHCSSFARSSSS
jgi:hypothetical protein